MACEAFGFRHDKCRAHQCSVSFAGAGAEQSRDRQLFGFTERQYGHLEPFVFMSAHGDVPLTRRASARVQKRTRGRAALSLKRGEGEPDAI